VSRFVLRFDLEVAMRSQALRRMSLDEFLEWERLQPTRHEFIDGEIVAMTGAHAGHVRMVGRIYARLHDHLHGSGCEAFVNDLKVTAAGDSFYPDVVVACGEARPHDDDDGVDAPLVVVEVISPGTASHDATVKRWAYMTLPSIKHYLVIHPTRAEAELVPRSEDGSPSSRILRSPDDFLDLPAVGFGVRLGDLYRDG
jgi:Uma2 family endonuclease